MPKREPWPELGPVLENILSEGDTFAILDALHDGTHQPPEELRLIGEQLLMWCLSSLVQAQMVKMMIEGELLVRPGKDGWEFRKRATKGVN